MIKAILFDVGEVLLSNPFEEVFQKIADKLKIEAGALNEFRLEYHQRLTTGRISVECFLTKLREKFNLDIKEEEIKKIWEESYLEVRTLNQELLEIVKKLKKKYRVGLISNIYDFCAKINAERGFGVAFEPAIMSYEVGLAKPEKEIFELALKRLNLEADECVFIDNKEKNLESPRKMGFKVFHFQNNAQLIDDFKRLGIEL
ncbi:MAG: HAD family phosphatase [Candidatus Nealsonbacteria bacterium]|nr:HAD family phosphatase [Candidatus Nealsonbacteria bacterium]